MLQQRIQEVKTKVNQLIVKADQLYGVKLTNVQIRFDLKGRAAGMAGYRWGAMYLRFNTDMMINDSWNHIINDTVPHEVAHLVTYANPMLGSRHDHGWKRVCRELGGSGERCHNEEVVFGKGKTFLYTATCGTQIPVSERIHRGIQLGQTRFLRRTGGKINAQCQYSLVGVSGRRIKPVAPKQQPVAVAPVVTPAPVVQVPMPVQNRAPIGFAPASGSKADMIRARIAQAKANGEHEDVVVEFGITALGMTRALAKTYVKGNWSKV